MNEPRPALFRRHPQLADAIPWTSLGRFPTPVEPLEIAGEGGAELYVKRDDRSGERYGGNKVRKLEFLLADAERGGAERLITAGAMGSHHALATTVYGRALGFRVTLVLFPQPLTDHVREVLLTAHALGADLRYARHMLTLPAGLLAARWTCRRERTYVIPPGGSNALGTLGYVNAALELAGQIERGAAPRPDVVHMAAGTLGTAAGLALGFALAGIDARVVATRITSRLVTNRRALRKLISRTARLLEDAGATMPAVDEALGRVTLRHGRYGRGYGHETEAGRHAAERFARAGLVLDPTYTAKAGAEVLASVRQSSGMHLFWHTLSATEPEAGGEADARDLPAPFRDYLNAG